MKLREKFSKNISNLLFRKSIARFQEKSLENTLFQAFRIADEDTMDEIRQFVLSCQNQDGGFADRAGRSDLYYSLFGLFLLEVFNEMDAISKLKHWVAKTNCANLQGVHLHCAAILFSKLEIPYPDSAFFRQKIGKNPEESSNTSGYQSFMTLLSQYYLKDFFGMFSRIKQLKKEHPEQEKPCTVLAAMLVLHSVARQNTENLKQQIAGFYVQEGGFKANLKIHIPDLLSTAVTLYALKADDSDLSLIRPDCLDFVSKLFFNGGFSSCTADDVTDIEYTFYGLLALGTLA